MGGIRVPIHLHCQDRAAKVFIKPTSSAQLIKDMGNYERDRKKKEKLENRKGNVTFAQVKAIAKFLTEEGKTAAKEFKGTVCSVLGTCLSVGATVDGKHAKEMTRMVKNDEIKL